MLQVVVYTPDTFVERVPCSIESFVVLGHFECLLIPTSTNLNN